MAGEIAGALGGYNVQIKDGSGFAGTDLLPADVLFIGCSEPSPACFSYLEEMFQHINLANRICGIFSSSSKSVKYIKRMINNSEIRLIPEFLTKTGSAEVKKWTARVMSGK